MAGDMFCQVLSLVTPRKKNKIRGNTYFDDFFVIGVDQVSLEDIETDVYRSMPMNLFRYS